MTGLRRVRALRSALELVRRLSPTGFAVVSLPSAPPLTRVLTHRPLVAAVRLVPWVALSLLPLAVLGFVLARPPSGGPLGVVTALFAGAASLVVLACVAAVWSANGGVIGPLDAVYGRLLARLPGAHFAPKGDRVVDALARLRAHGTPEAREFVRRALTEDGFAPSNGRETTPLVLRALVEEHEATSLLSLSRRGRDDGLVADALRLANLLPLGEDYAGVYGGRVERSSVLAARPVLTAVLADVDAGVPVEWAVRRADR